MAAIQIELPHVLNHRIAPDAAARAIADVIVHLAVVHHRTPPLVKTAVVPAEPGRVRHCVALRDQMIRRQMPHDICAERHRHSRAGTHRPRPRRNAVVNEVSKVRRRIVRVWHANAQATCIVCDDAIAHQPPMLLQRGGQLGRINPVLRRQIRPDAIVLHHDARPIGEIGRIVQLNVRAGIHDLMFQPH